MADDFIVIDRKVAGYFLHEMNHLSIDMVPKDIQEMEFTLRTGQRTSIKKLVEEMQGRAAKLGNYISLAMMPPKETE